MFRKRKLKLDSTLPIVALNSKDRQAHALDEKPVHSILPPVRFNSVEDLLAADAPRDPAIVEKWGIVCADNAVWPLSPPSLDQYVSQNRRTGVSRDLADLETALPSENGSLDDLRALKYVEYIEESRQRALHQATKADSKDALMSNLSIALVIISCAAMCLVGAVIAYYKFGPEAEVAKAASLLWGAL